MVCASSRSRFLAFCPTNEEALALESATSSSSEMGSLSISSTEVVRGRAVVEEDWALEACFEKRAMRFPDLNLSSVFCLLVDLARDLSGLGLGEAVFFV